MTWLRVRSSVLWSARPTGPKQLTYSSNSDSGKAQGTSIGAMSISRHPLASESREPECYPQNQTGRARSALAWKHRAVAGANTCVCASEHTKLADTPSRSARARAATIIASERSIPRQLPSAPRRRSIATVVAPVPQPTSSTCLADAAKIASVNTGLGFVVVSGNSVVSCHKLPFPRIFWIQL